MITAMIAVTTTNSTKLKAPRPARVPRSFRILPPDPSRLGDRTPTDRPSFQEGAIIKGEMQEKKRKMALVARAAIWVGVEHG
jgi:hypothetical protein